MSRALKPIVTDTYDFPTLIRRGYVYVDKTALLHRMISGIDGTCFFMSRPRRFGKSLMLSTLASIFNGEKKLFKGLDISRMKYDWKKYPVIRLDMSRFANVSGVDAFSVALVKELRRRSLEVGISFSADDSASTLLDLLIRELSKKPQMGQVVVLIDEYDNPISGLLNRPKELERMREFLHDFYRVLKADVANIRFLMMTGVSKFSKLSVFSGLNNLTDLTMHGAYAGLLGYTPEELEKFFTLHIREFAKVRKLSQTKVRADLLDWYDSYRFSPDSEVRVCNPVSVGRALAEKKIASFWSATGNATLIVERLRKAGKSPLDLRDIEISPEKLDVCDVRSLPFASLMYQGGYLTIKAVKPNGRLVLGVPNREISQSLDSGYVAELLRDSAEGFESLALNFRSKLESGGADAIISTLDAVFAMVPHEWKLKSEAEAKRYFLLFMKMAGADITPELESSKGRADAIIETEKTVYVFEFKRGKTAKAALNQIKTKGYGDPYAADKRQVVAIGVNFDPRTADVEAEYEVVNLFDEVVNSTDEVVNEVVKSHPGLRKPEIVPLVGKSRATVERALASLISEGRIEFRGAPKNGGYYPQEEAS